MRLSLPTRPEANRIGTPILHWQGPPSELKSQRSDPVLSGLNEVPR
jgi:hypothetical protein